MTKGGQRRKCCLLLLRTLLLPPLLFFLLLQLLSSVHAQYPRLQRVQRLAHRRKSPNAHLWHLLRNINTARLQRDTG